MLRVICVAPGAAAAPSDCLVPGSSGPVRAPPRCPPSSRRPTRWWRASGPPQSASRRRSTHSSPADAAAPSGSGRRRGPRSRCRARPPEPRRCHRDGSDRRWRSPRAAARRPHRDASPDQPRRDLGARRQQPQPRSDRIGSCSRAWPLRGHVVAGGDVVRRLGGLTPARSERGVSLRGSSKGAMRGAGIASGLGRRRGRGSLPCPPAGPPVPPFLAAASTAAWTASAGGSEADEAGVYCLAASLFRLAACAGDAEAAVASEGAGARTVAHETAAARRREPPRPPLRHARVRRWSGARGDSSRGSSCCRCAGSSCGSKTAGSKTSMQSSVDVVSRSAFMRLTTDSWRFVSTLISAMRTASPGPCAKRCQ